MDALIAKILGAISANGGRVLYDTLLNSLDYQERQIVANAIKQARSNGDFRRELTINPETKAVELYLTTDPIPTPE